ncbi:MAG: aspartate aminotransferase family protein, partial [Mycobacterium sp.]
FTAMEFVGGDSPDAATAGWVVNELRDRRILISSSGPHENVLKIRPPLPFTTEHADQLLGELDDVLAHAPR